MIPFCPPSSGVSQLIAIAVELTGSIDTFRGGRDGAEQREQYTDITIMDVTAKKERFYISL